MDCILLIVDTPFFTIRDFVFMSTVLALTDTKVSELAIRGFGKINKIKSEQIYP